VKGLRFPKMMPRISVAVLLFVVALPLQAQSFSGTVRNTDNQPLGDMTVQVYNASGFLAASATTDSLGRYVMPVAPGTYRLLAFDREGNYAVNFHRGATSFETSVPVNVTSGQFVTIDFILSRGAAISGTVFEAGTARPLAGALVAAYNDDGSRRTFTTSSASGSYTLIVPAGGYKVVAYHEAQAYVPEFFVEQRLFASAQVVNAPAAGINFTLERGSAVRGRVLEKGTSAPVANVNIVAYDLQGNIRARTETNATGAFTLVVPAGAYKFAAEDENAVFESTFFGDTTQFNAAAALAVDGVSVMEIQINAGRARTPTAKTTVWIAAAGSGPGANDTTFKTDLWIQNPGADAITVTATFLLAGRDNSSAPAQTLTVPARGQLSVLDVVTTLFAASGSFGGIRLESPAPFLAMSRTYNQPRNLQLGTYGLALPGQSIGGSRGRATLAGLAGNQLSRTNIGFLNPQPVPITVTITLFADDGTSLPSPSPVTLQPLEWRQIGVLNGVDNAYAIVSSPDGSFFSYAAVVDQRSGDGTIILPSAE
jgi:hypothetical protein